MTMKYDFETLIDRSNKGSSKWQEMKAINPDVPVGVAPLSVADVDIKLAPEIQEGLIEFLKDDPVLGYTSPKDDYYDAVINWMKNKFNYHVEKDWIVLSNGIVPALGDGVATSSSSSSIIEGFPITLAMVFLTLSFIFFSATTASLGSYPKVS